MESEHRHLLVYCTVPDEESALRISETLVEEALAACVNIVPGLRSVYRWKGRIEHDGELLLLIKTSTDRYPALQERIVALHPYELPEIVAVPLERGLPGYLQWIDQNTHTG